MDQTGGQIHQFVHDGTDAPSLGLVPWRCVRAEQAILANPTQDVVGQLSATEHQGIGGELARRQPLDVQVRLELAVVLLGGAVVGIQVDDLLLLAQQARPPAFDFDLRRGDQSQIGICD